MPEPCPEFYQAPANLGNTADTKPTDPTAANCNDDPHAISAPVAGTGPTITNELGKATADEGSAVAKPELEDDAAPSSER